MQSCATTTAHGVGDKDGALLDAPGRKDATGTIRCVQFSCFVAGTTMRRIRGQPPL